MTSNGYLVVGGGSAADVSSQNQGFPDGAPPNNVLAPFWTDLDGSAGGRYYAYRVALPGESTTWSVFEWEQAPSFSDHAPNSFQVWIGPEANGLGQDIWFSYGPELSAGDPAGLSVGAENAFGSSGESYFYNGRAARPSRAERLAPSAPFQRAPTSRSGSQVASSGNTQSTAIPSSSIATKGAAPDRIARSGTSGAMPLIT